MKRLSITSLFISLVISMQLGGVEVAKASDILIKNARIVDGSERGLNELTDILVKGSMIVGLGSGLSAPQDGRVIDADGRPVSPGLFNADTQLGIVELGSVAGTVDSSTSNENITASLQVSDAFNPSSVAVAYNRSLGITHSLIQPSNGTGIFAGSAAVVKLSNSGNIVVKKAAMVVSLGQAGSELAGGSRAAAMSLLREAIEDARDYSKNRDSYASGSRRDYSLSRHDLDALVEVVQRRQPLLVRVERSADIERVLEFAREQKIALILSGASEGWRVADRIAEAKVPVIFDPINNLPSSYETLGSRLDNARLLHDAGVKLMFTGMGWQNTHNAYLVRQSAGNAVANGLPYNVAIQAITSNPARIFGLPGYGQIKVGAEATLVLWSGDPLEVMSNPDLVLIDGQEYSLESRATRLRDRYYQRAIK
ncbi:MAG: imidazolonepropionase-like amidohydrolase [Arenicella sp.]|jgi:imidazolonepropionase-like amidohydrolase